MCEESKWPVGSGSVKLVSNTSGSSVTARGNPEHRIITGAICHFKNEYMLKNCIVDLINISIQIIDGQNCSHKNSEAFFASTSIIFRNSI